MALDIRSDNGELFACVVQLMLADAQGDFEQVAFYQQQIAARGWVHQPEGAAEVPAPQAAAGRQRGGGPMTLRNPCAQKEPSRRNHDLNGSKDNPSARKILPSWSGRGQQSHDPALSPGTSDPSTESSSVDQIDNDAVVRCWTKKTLCQWLQISVRSWDRAAAFGLTPAPDLVVGREARWSPSTIDRWLRTRPVLPGRRGQSHVS